MARKPSQPMRYDRFISDFECQVLAENFSRGVAANLQFLIRRLCLP
jgi:hypothetical protein